MTISLSFDHAETTGSYPNVAYQLLLGIEADFRLVVDCQEVLYQPHFPIVELRQWLAAWLGAGTTEDFIYTSIEAEETGLITFRRVGETEWAVDSAWSTLVQPPTVELQCLTCACKQFVANVDFWVAAQLGLHVQQVLGDLR